MPYRLFGSPIPLRCCFRSPLRFSGSRLPRNLTNTVHPLTDFGPSAELTPLALPLSKAMAYHFFSQGSSHEVLFPSSAQTLANRRIVRFHPNCLPSSAFLRPLRVYASLTLAALFRAAVTPGVHTLQSLIPSTKLYRTHRSAIPSQRFSEIPKYSDCALRALCKAKSRFYLGSIASLNSSMLSWAFSHFHGVLTL